MPSLNDVVSIQIHWFFISLVFGLLICRHEVGSISVQRQDEPNIISESYNTTYARKPYGPRMCGQLCKRINKCHTPLFNEEQLICYLSNPVSRKYHFTRLYTLKNYTASPCDGWSRFLFTRLHARKCVTIEGYIFRHHETEKILKPTKSNLTLHQACHQGNLDAVKYILSRNLEDINCPGKNRETPVMAASRRGHFEVFEYLVGQGCDLSLKDQNNDSVVHTACYGGNIDIVKKLITELKHDVDEVGGFGGTPVVCAVAMGHKEVVEFLVGHGCNATLAANNRNNILHIACLNGHKEIVEYIVEGKLVPIDSKGMYGRTAVMIAAEKGHKEIVKLLIREGCNPALLDDNSYNIMNIVCTRDNVDIVRYLISQNIVHKESRDQLGRTPLMIAAWSGSIGVFNILQSEGCSLREVDIQKNTVLHIACIGGHIDMVKHIIKQYNVDIESKGFQGRSPLLTAAEISHKAIFDFLVRKGCSIKAVDDNKNNILHLACLGGHLDMVKHIINIHNVDIECKGFQERTPLLTSVAMGRKAIFSFLVRKGCNIKAVDDHKNTILHVAILCGRPDMEKFIINQRIINIETRGYKGRTPLLTAARTGSESIFHLLEEKGCDMNAVDDENSNILFLACGSSNVKLVRYIVTNYKLDINCRGAFGATPVLRAAFFGDTEVVKFLKMKGCNMKAVDDIGNNIMHTACFGGKVHLVRYLVKLRVVSVNDRNKRGLTPLELAKALKYSELVDVMAGN